MIVAAAFFINLLLVLYNMAIIFLKKKINLNISYLYPFSALILLAEISIRSFHIKFPAVTNLFEALIIFSVLINILVFIYIIKEKGLSLIQVVFGATFINLVFLALAISPIISKGMNPPIPALQSNWLVLHVSFAFAGEAFFTLAFFSGLFYLISKDQKKKDHLDKLTYTFIGLGYPIYTAGALIFGSIWANYAWGSWWSWDPKETWALVTWLTYTFYLHLRVFKKKKGRITAVLSVAGYLFTLFTLFGVNYLIKSGLHSYK